MAAVYTSAGEALICDYIDGTASPGTHYIGAGTGAGAAGKGSTTLSTEVSEARVSATKSQPSPDINRWVATQTYTGSKTITNCGVFDAATNGTLIVMGDGLSIAVQANDAVEFTVSLEQT
jgi:hypothetical protein